MVEKLNNIESKRGKGDNEKKERERGKISLHDQLRINQIKELHRQEEGLKKEKEDLKTELEISMKTKNKDPKNFSEDARVWVISVDNHSYEMTAKEYFKCCKEIEEKKQSFVPWGGKEPQFSPNLLIEEMKDLTLKRIEWVRDIGFGHEETLNDMKKKIEFLWKIVVNNNYSQATKRDLLKVLKEYHEEFQAFVTRWFDEFDKNTLARIKAAKSEIFQKTQEKKKKQKNSEGEE